MLARSRPPLPEREVDPVATGIVRLHEREPRRVSSGRRGLEVCATV